MNLLGCAGTRVSVPRVVSNVLISILCVAAVPASADTIYANAASTLTYTEGISGLNIVGTFTDTDPTLLSSDFTVDINWADGTPDTAGIITSNGPGFDVSASHTYSDEGSFNPLLTFLTNQPAGDGNGSALDLAIVLDAPLDAMSFAPPSSVEGNSLSGVLGSFQDENTNASFSDFTANIDWGDGTITSGAVVPDGGGRFDIQGTHTYAEEGSYSVTANVLDTGGSKLTMSGTATVADAPLNGTGNVFAATAGVSFSGLVATFVDGNPSAFSTDFGASIDWGDGTTTPGVVAPSGGLFQISGTHTYAGPGTFQVTTQANDIGGASTILDGTADVTNSTPAGTPEPASWLTAAAGLAFVLRTKWRGSRNAGPNPGRR